MLPRTVPLGAGGEFDAIRRFLSSSGPLHAAVAMGAGDDASVLEGGWVVSTDLTVEDVHFRRTWISDEEIGGRAVLAALSDLAAMAARPVAVLASVAVPRGGRVDVDAVMTGVRGATEARGASLVGGDLSRSPGPLVLDVVVVGRSESPCSRAGSRAGDQIWVTGTLGASAAAVTIWEGGEEPPAGLRDAYVRPSPRIPEALDLAANGVPRGMIDLSDGLVGDVGHLAAAGGVRAVVEVDRIPVSEAVVERLGHAVALEMALHGGEDYELCFTAAAGSLDPVAWTAAAGVRVTRVGRMEEGSGVGLRTPDGEVREADRGGFDHFGSHGG
jgi:thiamine-monophosphate kinase